MFRLRIDTNLIAEDLTTVQAHLLVGEILERIALPKPLPSDDAEQPSSDSTTLPLGRRWTGIDRLSQANEERAVFTALPLAGLVGVLRHILAGARSDGIMSLIRSFAFLSRSQVARDILETVSTVRAIKDWRNVVPQHERHIRILQNLPRRVNVLSTHSSWLFSSVVLRTSTA